MDAYMWQIVNLTQHRLTWRHSLSDLSDFELNVIFYAYAALVLGGLLTACVSTYLRRAQILWFWSSKYKERSGEDGEEIEEECSICLEPMKIADRVKGFDACGHNFHAHCIEQWLCMSESDVCPLCRREHKLYQTMLEPANALL